MHFHEQFDDGKGDVILRAVAPREGGDSERTEYIHFQVDKAVLSRQSDVFDGMFTIPQPSDGPDPLRSVEVVDLQDDPEDLATLLSVLYYPEFLIPTRSPRKTFDFLLPALHLADKYNMNRLVDAILKRIKEDWPTTLAEWDRMEATARGYGGRSPSGELLNDYFPEPAGIIKLSHSFPALKDIVPAAFYHLSRISPFYDDGNRSKAGTDNYLAKGGRLARRTLLSREDLEALYFGVKRIGRLVKMSIKGSGNAITCSNGPSSRAMCDVSGWFRNTLATQALAIFGEDESDILFTLTILTSISGRPSKAICEECEGRVLAALARCRQAVWDVLPTAFRQTPYG